MSKEILISEKLKKVSRISLSVIALAGASCAPSAVVESEKTNNITQSRSPEIVVPSPKPTDYLTDINFLVQNSCALVGKGDIVSEGFLELTGESSAMSSDSDEIDRVISYKLHASQGLDSRYIVLQGNNPQIDESEPAPEFEEKVKVMGEIIKTDLGEGIECIFDAKSIQE